jgi:hypothetical protein
MTVDYKHTQIGYVTLIVVGVSILFLIYLSLVTNFNWGSIIVLLILLICLVLFATLTVTVNDRLLALQFSLGLIHKSFSLKDIKGYQVVKNPWYYGWGIHLTPRGWLFNVSGLSAIEIELKNGRLYRIGTDDAEGLAQAMGQALAQQF